MSKHLDAVDKQMHRIYYYFSDHIQSLYSTS